MAMRLDSSFAPVIHLANIYQAPPIHWTLCSGAKETEKETKDLCSEGAPGTSLGLSSGVTSTDTWAPATIVFLPASFSL